MPSKSTLAIQVKDNPAFKVTFAKDGNLLLSDLSKSYVRIYSDVTESAKSQKLTLEFVL
jgi:hypothetical protein